MRLRGFTLVEMLVVIVVIIILMGIGVSVFKSVSHSEQRGRTQAIVSVVATALAAAGAEGRSVVTAEHPLAGSMTLPPRPTPSTTNRPMFFRAIDHTIVGNGTEQAHRGVSQSDLSGSDGIVLADDDWFHGDSNYGDDTPPTPVPHLYGLPRRMCRVLGSAPIDITFYRTLSLRPGASPGTASISTPASTTSWPYSRTLTAPGYKPQGNPQRAERPVDWYNQNNGGTLKDVRNSIQGTLSPSGALEELTKLRALFEPKMADRDLDVNPVNPKLETESAFVLDKRVILPEYNDPIWVPRRSATWFAGSVVATPDPPTLDPYLPKTFWSTWRLRNLALYDGWGRELLVWQDAGGGFNVMSAGRDGSFRWLPMSSSQSGATFTTKPWDTTASGGDKDAWGDNIQVGSDTP